MPQINASFNPLLIKKVDKVAKKNKQSRSETIERLTELGLEVVNGNYVPRPLPPNPYAALEKNSSPF